MTDGILNPISHVQPQSGHRLLITWASGERASVDFTADVERGGVWAALRDASKFAQVRVAYDGCVLEWPEPAGANGEPRIDVDADGLHEMAMKQRAHAPGFSRAG